MKFKLNKIHLVRVGITVGLLQKKGIIEISINNDSLKKKLQ